MLFFTHVRQFVAVLVAVTVVDPNEQTPIAVDSGINQLGTRFATQPGTLTRSRRSAEPGSLQTAMQEIWNEQRSIKWKEVKGRPQQEWGKLTNDDLDQINGKRDEFSGRLQKAKRLREEQAEKEIDEAPPTLTFNFLRSNSQ